MGNDVLDLSTIVEKLGHNIAELAQIGRDGFILPSVITSNEMTALVGLPLGSWQPAGKDLVWFQACKTAVYARHMIEETGRIFGQMEDAEMAEKMDSLLELFDDQLHPGQTAFQVYDRLLSRHSNSTKNEDTV